MAENKIPVLTEVYQPKVAAKSKTASTQSDFSNLTPELVAKIVSHVRPTLEEEILQSVVGSLREHIRTDLVGILQVELKKTQTELEANTKNFIDKAKADLKTELPSMYQQSVSLAEVNFAERLIDIQTEASAKFDKVLNTFVQSATKASSKQIATQSEELQQQASEQVWQHLKQKMEVFKGQLLEEQQTQLSEAMGKQAAMLNQSAIEAAQQQLLAFHETLASQHKVQISQTLDSQMQSLQESTYAGLQGHLEASLDKLLPFAVKKVEHKLLQQITESQLTAQKNAIEQMQSGLSDAVPGIFASAAGELKAKFTQEMTAQSGQLRENFLNNLNGDLPEVKETLRGYVDELIGQAAPKIEENLRRQLTGDLEALLLQVKFVLPAK